jgi:Domain of unknown function (DUF1918)
VKAKVGDRLVTEGAHVDAPRRIGHIVELTHADGSPPYMVRWLDGHQTLCFPSSDSHLEPETEPDVEARADRERAGSERR